MREKIIDAIRKYWYEDIFPGIKMNLFIRDVVPLYKLMESLGFNDGQGTVAITGHSSKTWIAAYIAALLKGCTLVIIPKDMSKKAIKNHLLLTDANLLITDDYNRDIFPKPDGFYGTPLLLGVYNAESFDWVWRREDVYNQTLAVSSLRRDDVFIDYKDIDRTFHNMYTNDVETVMTPTSGVEYAGAKYVVSSAGSIDTLITKSIDLLPYDMGDKVYCGIDYSTTHFLTVLIPFLKGCVFTIHPRDAEVFIENTQSMELIWRQRVDSVLENSILYKLFMKTAVRRLFKGLAVRRLKSYFSRGRKLKSLMILNWFGSERIISTIKGRLPLFTTYGSQECNQLIAYNDYSTKELRRANAAGKFIRGYDWKIDTDDFNELLLSSKSMFIKYHADVEFTEQVKDHLWYYTGDIANVSSNGVLYVYGRKKRLFADNTGFTINMDNMARIITNLVYVKEAVLVSFVEGESIEFTLAIHPDYAFAESKGLTEPQLKELFRDAATKLQRELVGDYKITRVLVRPTPFLKTFDGKIEKRLYPAITIK